MAKKKSGKTRKLLWTSLVLIGLGSGFVAWTNYVVTAGSEQRIYTTVDKVPEAPIAIVLGTAPTVNGNKNLFFERRMDAAAELYRAHKVSKLLVSGDNHVATYDEPTAMKAALVARGVPASQVKLDYAGFHTLDTIVRAHKVFGVNRCILVSDDFHLPRALYIAKEEGVDAVGYQTRPLDHSYSPSTYVREIGARSLIWLDLHVLNRKPKFLGPHEML